MTARNKVTIKVGNAKIPALTRGKIVDMPSKERLQQLGLLWSRTRYSRKYVVMQFPKVHSLVLVPRPMVLMD